MTIPVWLLDVDGVINAITGKAPSGPWPRNAWRLFDHTNTLTGEVWPIRTAQPVVDFIRKVHEQGRAQIRWHTTWQESANDLGAELGLPEFSVLAAPEFTNNATRHSWWKLPGALRVLDEERPLVWTDDDATVGRILPTLHDWLCESPNLLIAPRLHLGLTPKHLAAIDRHLDEVAASTERRSA